MSPLIIFSVWISCTWKTKLIETCFWGWKGEQLFEQRDDNMRNVRWNMILWKTQFPLHLSIMIKVNHEWKSSESENETKRMKLNEYNKRNCF